MNILVVGAGVVGITTAWELANDGHAVTVVDRNNAAAEEGSFAPTGLLSPGTAVPLAGESFPWQLAKTWLWPHPLLAAGGLWRSGALHWWWQWLHQSKPANSVPHLTHLFALASDSLRRFDAINKSLNFEFERGDGTLLLWRSDKDRQTHQGQIAELRTAGIVAHEIDASKARELEPLLSTSARLSGALHLPHDQVANCRQWTLLLKAQAQRAGVQFEFNCTVQSLQSSSDGGVLVGMAGSQRLFDAVVLCTGSHASGLERLCGQRLPWMSLSVHSVSAPLRDTHNGPRSGVVDATSGVSIARLGNRVRVSGGLALGAGDPRLRRRTLEQLYQALNDWFPAAALSGAVAQQWRGSSAALPDGLPAIGPSRQAGVWLNLGHAQHGWMLACGSARHLADQVAQRTASVPVEPFAPSRWA